MSMIGNQPGVSSQRTVLEEVVTGSPKSAFVPQSGYIKGYVDVLVNGTELDASDFTAADGITINLAVAAAVGDTVKVKAWLPRGLSDGYLKSEADAKFAPLVNGNMILAPNAGGNRVIGFASGTDTTLVIQGGGTSGSGANIELTRDYLAYLDANTTTFRSVDGATVYAVLNANGMGIGGNPEAGSQLRTYNGSGHGKITIETTDAYAAFVNYSGATSEFSAGFVKSDNSFRFCAAGDLTANERGRFDGNGCFTVPNQVRVVLVGGGGSKAAGTYNYWGDTAGRVLANTGGGWNYSTQVFTAPVTGNYLVSAHIRMSSEGSSSYNYMQFENTNNTVNGTPIELWAPGVQSGGTYRPRQLTAMIRLNKNDTLTPRLYLNGTATFDGGSTGQADDYLNITLIN